MGLFRKKKERKIEHEGKTLEDVFWEEYVATTIQIHVNDVALKLLSMYGRKDMRFYFTSKGNALRHRDKEMRRESLRTAVKNPQREEAQMIGNA